MKTTTNKYAPLHSLRPVGGYKAGDKTPPPVKNVMHTPLYRVGDGEVINTLRPGAMDAHRLPSLIGGVRIYARSSHDRVRNGEIE